MANLTLEKRLVRPLGTPRPEPGHHVVVYRESAGGRIFYQALARGERFKPPLRDRLWGTFAGYAVQAGYNLRHQFSDQFLTGAGDKYDAFQLRVTMLFRVTAPEALVDRLSDDPLGILETEVRTVFRRRASDLTYHELIDGEFDLEGYLLQDGEPASGASGAGALERLRGLAQELGIDLERVEVTRTFSSRKVDAGIAEVEAAYAAQAQGAAVQGEQQVTAVRIRGETELDILRAQKALYAAQSRRQVEVLDGVAQGLTTIIQNISRDTGTVPEFKSLLAGLATIQREIDSMIGPGSAAELPPALNEGPNLGRGALAAEIRLLFEMMDSLKIEPPVRAGLEGRLLHVLGEVRMDGDSDGERLEGFVDEMRRFSADIDLSGSIADQRQRHYFGRFRDAETVRHELAALSTGPVIDDESAP